MRLTEVLNQICDVNGSGCKDAAPARSFDETSGQFGSARTTCRPVLCDHVRGQAGRPTREGLYLAADHGVVDEGVSAYPRDVTAQMVLNFLRGGAGVNVLARHAGVEVRRGHRSRA